MNEMIDRSAGMTCGRCNRLTGNNTQGHYWAICKVTGTLREHHFCCPGDCQLETAQSSPTVATGITR